MLCFSQRIILLLVVIMRVFSFLISACTQKLCTGFAYTRHYALFLLVGALEICERTRNLFQPRNRQQWRTLSAWVHRAHTWSVNSEGLFPPLTGTFAGKIQLHQCYSQWCRGLASGMTGWVQFISSFSHCGLESQPWRTSKKQESRRDIE